jgi:hypothetical protein
MPLVGEYSDASLLSRSRESTGASSLSERSEALIVV